jgi:hypothetical protein
MDELKLLGRDENDLQNELKIVQTIGKDIDMNFGLEKCARMCLKRGRVQSKVQIGNTLENDIKELDPSHTHSYIKINTIPINVIYQTHTKPHSQLHTNKHGTN